MVYCTEFILNNVFPENFNSVFYPNVSEVFFNIKQRNIDKIKTKILIETIKKGFALNPSFRLDFFILNIINLDCFPIKQNFMELRIKTRKEDHIKKSIISISINQGVLKKIDHIDKKISSFLKPGNPWKSLSKKSLTNKNILKLRRTKKKYFSKQHSESHFVTSYYSISKYFCWDNPVKNAHFLYYMTCFPKTEDQNIVNYILTPRHKLQKTKSNPQTGAEVFNTLLKDLSKKSKLNNLSSLERQIRINLFEMHEFSSLSVLFQKVKLLRRLKLVWYFRLTLNSPSWMILSLLPVLPPDLRPIIQLEGSQIAISDLNKLYQKVLFRNNRIQKLKIGHYSKTSEEAQYAQRLLQEAVDSLIENGKGGGVPSCSLNGRPLKSLSDILKGKKGRFRQNLLGKRVDYSGRSVIVVGPHLRIHECGIPHEMAIELFQPFLIRRIIFEKKARTILGAKQMIHQGGAIIKELLSEIMQNHPVLLNRAPTLHRLSIQSFQPRLVEGRAIILHPLVCSAFNADFDGDQMAVHVPLSYQARSEAWKLLWAQNNLLSPATGQPILVPSQDIVLGWYFLTAMDLKFFFINLLNSTKKKINLTQIEQIFQFQKIVNFYQLKIYKKTIHVFLDYEQKKINIHTPIWFAWKGLIESDKKIHSTVEIRLNTEGRVLVCSHQFQVSYNWYGFKINQLICTTAGRVLLNYLTHKLF